jgi:hypothetical protein
MNERQKLKKECWKLRSILVRKGNADWRGYVKCFTCGAVFHYTKIDAGHFIHKACFDHEPININPQCKRCNRWLHGNLGVYAANLIKKHGLKKFQSLEAKRFKKKDYTIKELRKIKEKLLSEIKKLEK